MRASPRGSAALGFPSSKLEQVAELMLEAAQRPQARAAKLSGQGAAAPSGGKG